MITSEFKNKVGMFVTITSPCEKGAKGIEKSVKGLNEVWV